MAELLLPAFRFGVVGVLATGVHVAVFLLFVRGVHVSPTLATVPAFLAAVLTSYRLNHAWTFGVKGRHFHYFPRYLAITLVGLALNVTIMYACTEIWHWGYYVGLALVVSAVPAFNFLCSRFWGFR